MISAEFKEAMRSATIAGPASESMIQAAENRLSLRFPPEYRRFLEEYGAAGLTGFDIAGLVHEDYSEPPFWVDIVTGTERFREMMEGSLPDTMVPISHDGCEIQYLMDLADQDGSACPVFQYGPEVNGEMVAKSLEEFIVKIAAGEIWD